MWNIFHENTKYCFRNMVVKRLSELRLVLVIFVNFFSGIPDTFQNILRDMGYHVS